MKTETIFIPYILRSGAIFQRGQPFHFWGTASPNTDVTLILKNNEFYEKADQFGKFRFNLGVQNAGGPYTITIKASDTSISINNILFGDVWLLGGQSNMQLWMDRLKAKYPQEEKNANNDNIRFFEVPQRYSFDQPDEELDSGKWLSATESNIKKLSGIGYFFAQRSYIDSDVPIGLVETAIGGTHIDSWMSQETLQSLGEPVNNLRKLFTDEYINEINKSEVIYEKEYLQLIDSLDTGLKERWYDNFTDNNWKLIKTPELYNTLPAGVVWLKKEINIPDSYTGKNAEIRLGTLTDADEVFINGIKIGETGYKYPPRNYPIKKLSKHIELVIRLKTFWGNGGLTNGKDFEIITDQGTINIDSDQRWKIKRSCILPERKDQFFFQYCPYGLFNGMIHPIRSLKFKGILWYQGESDTGKPNNYGILFSHLIQDWRKIFNNNELPFIFVQLPNCNIEPYHDWAQLRQEQTSALRIDKTAMIVSLGLGEDNDLHPLNKKAIANQLYNASNKIDIYKHGYCDGPLIKDASQNNNMITLKFINLNGALVISDPSIPFELINHDSVINLYDYSIHENEIRIAIDRTIQITKNSRIRYGWKNAPKIGISNTNHISISPFNISIN